MKKKEGLADEVFRAQPNMLGSFLVQKQFGVSIEKMDFLLDLLLICFQAMKESALAWPLITEDEIDRQMQRYIAIVKFAEGLGTGLRDQSMRQYVDSHPEKELLAWVQHETANWLKRIVSEETDKYVMMAAANFVNCIAFVTMETQKSAPSRRQVSQ